MVGPWLPPADLTASGRPALLPGEIERFLVPSVDLNPETPALPPLRSGVLSLTTHRLIWIEDRSASAFSLPLAAVVHIFPLKTKIFHSPRVRIQVSVSADGRVGERGERSEVVVVVMRRKNDPDVFYHKLVEVWGSRSWERGVEEVGVNGGEGTGGGWSGEGTSSRPWAAPVVGVSGILRKEQEIWESTDKSLQDAFQDLNALMSKAKEMVMLAEKMRQKLLSGSTSQANAGNDEEMGSKQEMQDWLLSVGIASPVTKESAGALYHQQLSRQVGPDAQKKFEQTIFFSHSHLADFVKPQLERAGGMMALIDIYCHFNRARGTALISPEDLLQACALWEKIDVPVTLRKFDSGVMVIQNKAHSDEEVFARIRSLVMKPDALQKGISPSDAAITLGVAPALAKEHLLAAENKGLLCRDISPEGFRFYVNLFKDVNPGDMYRVNDHSLLHVWVSATAVTG